MLKLLTKRRHPLHLLQNERGVAAMTIAMMATVVVGMAAFAIDIGHAVVTRNELQNAADAAALAAGTTLGMTYYQLPKPQQQDLNRVLTGDEEAAVLAGGIAAALGNGASDVHNLTLVEEDMRLGNWDMEAQTFTPGNGRPNAIQVTVRRDDAQNGPISTFLAGILGVHELNITATAVAALGVAGGPSAPGEANVPFAISNNWFNGVANCGDGIQFSPTGPDGCAGWHVFDQQPANSRTLRDTIDGLKDGSYESPGIIPGDTQFEFTGGEVSSAFPNLIELWNQEKEWNDDTGRDEWNISLPVYEAVSGTCGNPSGAITIVGYANAVVTQVAKNDIQAEVQCDTYFKARPGSPPPDNGGGMVTPLSPFAVLVQ